jgi:MFS transporter, DHA1 family, multidrug resistance protein
MSQLGVRLLRRRSPVTLMRAALVAQVCAGTALVIAALGGHPPLLSLLIPFFAFVAAYGMMRPNGTAVALARQAQAAGTASAYLGALQFTLGAVLAPAAGAGGQGAVLPAALLIGFLCAGSLSCQLLLTPTRGPRPDTGPAGESMAR